MEKDNLPADMGLATDHKPEHELAKPFDDAVRGAIERREYETAFEEIAKFSAISPEQREFAYNSHLTKELLDTFIKDIADYKLFLNKTELMHVAPYLGRLDTNQYARATNPIQNDEMDKDLAERISGEFNNINKSNRYVILLKIADKGPDSWAIDFINKHYAGTWTKSSKDIYVKYAAGIGLKQAMRQILAAPQSYEKEAQMPAGESHAANAAKREMSGDHVSGDPPEGAVRKNARYDLRPRPNQASR